MKLAVFMDPLASLLPEKDTSLALIEAAQAMGWPCVYFTPADLFCRDGRGYARVTALEPQQQPRPLGEQALADFDLILVRKDPPFDLQYVYATYALELAEREGVLVVNKPQSLREANEKMATLWFPQCCPSTLVSQDPDVLRQFWEQHRHVIFKPLDGMGGTSVFEVAEDGRNLAVILESMTRQGQASIMAQRYLPEIITKGDKRILVINGEPVPFGLARMPAPGDFRGNLAAGAKGVVQPITERDRWLVSQLAPSLRAKGLYLVGLDVIGDYITEINVTSPTCLRQIAAATGLDIAGDCLRALQAIRDESD